MWKLTGSRFSCAEAHIGSQWRSVSLGSPNADGSWLKTTPLWPAAAVRSISARVASRSQNGSDATGMYRPGATAAQSVRKSL
jgi:hypothetical protein